MATTHRGSHGTIYVARIVDGFHEGAIKIGFAQNLDRRMRQLHGEIIATAPGSYVQEQFLLRLCPRAFRINPRWPEWFSDDVLDALRPAWGRMFDADLPVLREAS